MSIPGTGKKTINLTDCLKEFFDPVSKEKCGYKCEKCNTKDEMEKATSIFRYPKILVINLKRFKGSTVRNRKKLEAPIDVPLTLDMSVYKPHFGK